jgi:hypothetical protein
MSRPPADTLLPVVFYEAPQQRGGPPGYRVRPEIQDQVLAELRCPRKRHLIAVVVRTTHGLWFAWRRPFGEGSWDYHGGYECAWHVAWDPQIENAGCTCRTRGYDGDTRRRVWIVPLYWLVEQHGVVMARVERKTAVT